MTKGLTRPRDPVQLAATIIGLATGQISESEVVADRAPKRRAGGIEGGRARAKALTSARRTEIAQAGARARWGGRAGQSPGEG
ncbi:MAG: histone H1 [Acidobacteria bacterium]|nr:histone H1 [Acidobacteriota bacterium]